MTLEEAKTLARAGIRVQQVDWPSNQWIEYIAPEFLPVPQLPEDIEAGKPVIFSHSIERFILMDNGKARRVQLSEGNYIALI